MNIIFSTKVVSRSLRLPRHPFCSSRRLPWSSSPFTSRLRLYLPRELHWRDWFWSVPPELLLKLNHGVAFFSASMVRRRAGPQIHKERTNACIRGPAATLQAKHAQLGPPPCATTLGPPSAAQPPAQADPPTCAQLEPPLSLSLTCPSSTFHGVVGLLKVLPQPCLTNITTSLTCSDLQLMVTKVGAHCSVIIIGLASTLQFCLWIWGTKGLEVYYLDALLCNCSCTYVVA